MLWHVVRNSSFTGLGLAATSMAGGEELGGLVLVKIRALSCVSSAFERRDLNFD
jgi:hypothetical protein